MRVFCHYEFFICFLNRKSFCQAISGKIMNLSILWEKSAVKGFSYLLSVHDYRLSRASANFTESLYIIVVHKHLPQTVSN